MDRKDEAGSESQTGKGVSILNRNVLVFAFFLFLSFIFWYLNSLGKDLETEIKYPVTYTNIPKNKVLSENIPSRINLSLNGPGYSILRLKISGKYDPVIIDFSDVIYKQVRNSKSDDYYIVTSGLIPIFNSQLKSECKIISIKPDTLFFSLSQTLK
jgi:hypothetical protein